MCWSLSFCCERYTLCWLLVVLLVVHSSDDYIINSVNERRQECGALSLFHFIIHSLRIHQKCTRLCVVFSDISSGRVRCSFSVVISFFKLQQHLMFHSTSCQRLVDPSDDWRSLFFLPFILQWLTPYIHTEHLFKHIVDGRRRRCRL